jgi:hypothetical protein
MGWNDHINETEEDRKDFLRQLVDMGRLEGPALGITKKVIAEDDANFKNLEQTPVDPPAVAYKLDRDDGSVKFPTEKTGKAA